MALQKPELANAEHFPSDARVEHPDATSPVSVLHPAVAEAPEKVLHLEPPMVAFVLHPLVGLVVVLQKFSPFVEHVPPVLALHVMPLCCTLQSSVADSAEQSAPEFTESGTNCGCGAAGQRASRVEEAGAAMYVTGDESPIGFHPGVGVEADVGDKPSAENGMARRAMPSSFKFGLLLLGPVVLKQLALP